MLFRLIRVNDLPHTNRQGRSYSFGLQDKKQNITLGYNDHNGYLAFDFSLMVKHGADLERPVFTGPFASGPVNDRFVYLSWKLNERGYLNRIKARLGSIDWELIRIAQRSNSALEADMTGWVPHDPRKSPEWRTANPNGYSAKTRWRQA